MRSILCNTFLCAVLLTGCAGAVSASQDCASSGKSDFEYMVGSWREIGSASRIRIEKILDGCGYMEIWELEEFNAVLLRTYDGASAKWHLSFAADDLVPQIWEGEKENGQWYFFRDWNLNGEPRRSRTFWRKISEDSFEMYVEQSTDGGKTWKPHVKEGYERAKTAGVAKRVVLESDGWKLFGDLVIPAAKGRVPAVLMLNKANGDRKAYESLAEKLAERGIASFRLDLRAHGESDNKGRFGPPFDEKARALLNGSEDDISAAYEFLRSHRDIDPARIGIVGSSYSGEQMAVAARRGGYAKAYVALSPGSFSDESIAAIDKTGIPWFFIRSVDEIALMNDVFAAILNGSKTARTMRVSGSRHASDILADHPEVNEMIAVWFAGKL